VVHRDVKPPNVLMTLDGTPVLSDFGIARILEGSRRLTRTGIGIGTPEYMAPEQAMGQPVGPAADNYALGVIAYEMLTGALPFTSSTPMAVAVAHAQQAVPRPRTRNPILSGEVEAILMKALAKRPEERFATATELVEALEAARSENPVNAAPPTPAPPSTPVPQGTLHAAETTPVGQAVVAGPETASLPGGDSAPILPMKERGPTRRLVVAGVLAALVILVGGVIGIRALALPGAGAAPPIDEPTRTVAAPQVLFEDSFSDASGARCRRIRRTRRSSCGATSTANTRSRCSIRACASSPRLSFRASNRTRP
jgi:hypothetical protein